MSPIANDSTTLGPRNVAWGMLFCLSSAGRCESSIPAWELSGLVAQAGASLSLER